MRLITESKEIKPRRVQVHQQEGENGSTKGSTRDDSVILLVWQVDFVSSAPLLFLLSALPSPLGYFLIFLQESSQRSITTCL